MEELTGRGSNEFRNVVGELKEAETVKSTEELIEFLISSDAKLILKF